MNSRDPRVASAAAVAVVLLLVIGGIVIAHAGSTTAPAPAGGSSAKPAGSTLTPARCTAAPDRGTVTHVQVPGPVAQLPPRTLVVYLPPAWCLDDTTTFPVVMLIHGTPSVGGGSWTDGSHDADEIANAFAADHGGKAPVIIAPDAGAPDDTECADSEPYGPVETYLTRDVVDHVRNDPALRGRLAAAPDGWAVAGFSMGGTCALMLALRHPDLWRTFGDFSGDYFGTLEDGTQDEQRAATIDDFFGGDAARYDGYDPSARLRVGHFPGMAGWFEVGAEDEPVVEHLRQYRDEAAAAGIETCWSTVAGEDHTYESSMDAWRDSLPWFAMRLGLVPGDPAAACPQPSRGESPAS